MKSYSNETLHVGIDIHAPVSVERFQHLLPEEHLGFILIQTVRNFCLGADWSGLERTSEPRYFTRLYLAA